MLNRFYNLKYMFMQRFYLFNQNWFLNLRSNKLWTFWVQKVIPFFYKWNFKFLVLVKYFILLIKFACCNRSCHRHRPNRRLGQELNPAPAPAKRCKSFWLRRSRCRQKTVSCCVESLDQCFSTFWCLRHPEELKKKLAAP